jgi:hypothetical protein
MSLVRGIIAFATVAFASGCVSVSRYSVFGLEGWQTESQAQARAASFTLLAVVALASAAAGVAGCRLVQRRRANREPERLADSSPTDVPASANR